MTALRPPNFPWLSPYILLKEVSPLLDFYQRAFGFQLKEAHTNEQGETFHAEMLYQDQVVMFGKQNPAEYPGEAPISSGTPSPIYLYAYCADVDAFCANAVNAGAKLLLAPKNEDWGDRTCRLQDPAGYIWTFATHQQACQKNN